jgi:hypothetical protein
VTGRAQKDFMHASYTRAEYLWRPRADHEPEKDYTTYIPTLTFTLECKIASEMLALMVASEQSQLSGIPELQ